MRLVKDNINKTRNSRLVLKKKRKEAGMVNSKGIRSMVVVVKLGLVLTKGLQCALCLHLIKCIVEL